MALFNFGKKKEEKNVSCGCSCGGICDVEIPKVNTNTCCGENVNGICCIKVLGAGCKSCHEQYEYAKEAVSNLGLNIEVEYITDMEKVMSYGVMSMPVVVINENVVSQGKVLKTKEVEKLISDWM